MDKEIRKLKRKKFWLDVATYTVLLPILPGMVLFQWGMEIHTKSEKIEKEIKKRKEDQQ